MKTYNYLTALYSARWTEGFGAAFMGKMDCPYKVWELSYYPYAFGYSAGISARLAEFQRWQAARSNRLPPYSF